MIAPIYAATVKPTVRKITPKKRDNRTINNIITDLNISIFNIYPVSPVDFIMFRHIDCQTKGNTPHNRIEKKTEDPSHWSPTTNLIIDNEHIDIKGKIGAVIVTIILHN